MKGCGPVACSKRSIDIIIRLSNTAATALVRQRETSSAEATTATSSASYSNDSAARTATMRVSVRGTRSSLVRYGFADGGEAGGGEAGWCANAIHELASYTASIMSAVAQSCDSGASAGCDHGLVSAGTIS